MTNIEIVNINNIKQESCRIMICQMDATKYEWKSAAGLFFLQKTEKLVTKIRDLLVIANQNQIDVIVFPELSIPENMIEIIQDWSKKHGTISISGSHYYDTKSGFISRSAIVINGGVHFIEKINPAPIEKSPVLGEGLLSGSKVKKFVNTIIGDFSVLICSDYLDEKLKTELDLNSLDLLFVCAFQKNSIKYYSRMNIDCENSIKGIYIIYSNFLDSKNGDGRSAFFGIMDRLFTEKLKVKGYTDQEPSSKLFEFGSGVEYAIFDADLDQKKPFLNRNINSSPNVKLVTHSMYSNDKNLGFMKKIAHDDERYKRIDELFVPPTEFELISNTIHESNLVIIVGDPGIGKTYTAAKLLKEYYLKGFEPIWIAGLAKEERDVQSRILQDFIPTEKQIVYFEDPFGRTAFERRDSLLQIFTPLFYKLAESGSKVIITSRKEIFEEFSKESLLDNEVLKLKRELNVRNPSYDKEGLTQIFNKLGVLVCDWFENDEFRKIVYQEISAGKLSTPLAIREFVYNSRTVSTDAELKDRIGKMDAESSKAFALEILSANETVKLVLYVVFFCGLRGKIVASDIFSRVAKKLVGINLQIQSYSFNLEIRSQIGYRVEQLGAIRVAYRISHPVYEEALSTLFLSNTRCELISKLILEELILIDVKFAYNSISRTITKYPKLALTLFEYLLDVHSGVVEDESLAISIGKKLISVYIFTGRREYFNLASTYCSLETLIDRINSGKSSGKSLITSLELVNRYANNSPEDFDISLVRKLNYRKIFSQRGLIEQPTKLINILSLCHKIKPSCLSDFFKVYDNNSVTQIFLNSEKTGRKFLLELLREYKIYDELKRLINFGQNTVGRRKQSFLYREYIFSQKKYYGELVVDIGAIKALRYRKTNLMPAGILHVGGDFSEGEIVGVFNQQGELVGVGVAEYTSKQLRAIAGHSSYQFQELIGFIHSSCAIRRKWMLWFRYEKAHKAAHWRRG